MREVRDLLQETLVRIAGAVHVADVNRLVPVWHIIRGALQTTYTDALGARGRRLDGSMT